MSAEARVRSADAGCRAVLYWLVERGRAHQHVNSDTFSAPKSLLFGSLMMLTASQLVHGTMRVAGSRRDEVQTSRANALAAIHHAGRKQPTNRSLAEIGYRNRRLPEQVGTERRPLPLAPLRSNRLR